MPNTIENPARIDGATPGKIREKKVYGYLLVCSILVLSLPAALFEVLKWLPKPVEKILDLPPLGGVLTIVWFLVAIVGYPALWIAVALDVVLVFLRRVPILVKLLTTAALIPAWLGTRLIYAQFQNWH